MQSPLKEQLFKSLSKLTKQISSVIAVDRVFRIETNSKNILFYYPPSPVPSELLQYLQIAQIARDPGQPLEEPGRGCHVKYTVKNIEI